MKADQLVLRTVIQLVKKDEDDHSTGPIKLVDDVHIVFHYIAMYHMVSYDILWYPIPFHGIACFCDVGFGARAVSRKTPIYFIL